MKVRLLATRCFVFSAREKSYFIDDLVFLFRNSGFSFSGFSFSVPEYHQRGRKLSNFRLNGKIVDPCNSLRRRNQSEFTIALELEFARCIFRLEDLTKAFQMTSL